MSLEELKKELEGINSEIDELIKKLDEPDDKSEDDPDEERMSLDEIEKRAAELTEKKADIEEKIKATERAEEKRAALEKMREKTPKKVIEIRGAKEMTLEELRKSHDYNMAYAEFIKTGKDEEVRALLTDLVNPGTGDSTIPVPTILSDAIATAWNASKIFSRIQKLDIKGSYEAVFELSATGAAVHVEGSDAPAAEKLTFGTVKIDPEYVKKWIPVSDKVLSLRGEAFLNYLNAEITYQIDKLLDHEVVNAITSAPATSSATAAGVATATASEIIDAVPTALAKLTSDATNVVAIMNTADFYGKLMTAKGTDGHPIYNTIMENNKITLSNYGVEVILDDNVASNHVLVGDLDGILAVTPNGAGVEFVVDPYTLAEANKVKVVGKELVGIAVVRPGYFANVTVSAGA